MADFIKYGKTPRLYRDIVISEKIDGTNGAVQIWEVDPDEFDPNAIYVEVDGIEYGVAAQSRNRFVLPGNDNQGFGAWVWNNATNLVRALGTGVHFGEWFGYKIQGNPYRLDEKRFYLFNSYAYGETDFTAFDLPNVDIVPVMYRGKFDQERIDFCINDLKENGSLVMGADFTFGKAEGVIVYHEASRQVFKVLCDNDELPKGVAALSLAPAPAFEAVALEAVAA